MDWVVEFKPAAAKELGKLPRDVQAAVLAALERLLDELRAQGRPVAADVKKLKGFEPPQYRLRVGEYRVRFLREDREIEVDGKKQPVGVVLVVYARNRRDAYEEK